MTRIWEHDQARATRLMAAGAVLVGVEGHGLTDGTAVLDVLPEHPDIAAQIEADPTTPDAFRVRVAEQAIRAAFDTQRSG